MRFRNMIGLFTTAAAVVLMNTGLAAQLTDLQPGRNFVSSAQFGTGRSENVDVGDVDNDGDLDVIIANGGDGSAQANRIYINNGGLQAGTLGTFSDGTAARFAGVPNDTSRDIEFMDHDNDGDLDIYVSNRGTSANGGEVSRFYENLGGIQAGTVGFYTEDSDDRWGALASVPIGDQVLGGNVGPFRDFSCDCEFGDLDDDGDVDLFHSSYGLNVNGTGPSRVFENDGAGVFDEIFPWVNAGADIATHTFDLDLGDLDGDFDLDIFMSSRDSQARVFTNNLVNPASGSMFQDVTQTVLIATGATLSGTNNYEAEIGDVDGDGDFDVWAKNYQGLSDRILLNRTIPFGTFTFVKMNDWIKGDPAVDENEIDFNDFDGDGDLDAFVANFSGTNSLYYNGLNQGLSPATDGLFHRAGTAGTLADGFDELPTSGNGGTTLDGEVGDMDNDGDDDLLLSNDGGQQNRYFENVGGIPDTHAPSFHALTSLTSVPNGSATVVHAQIRDNTAYYLHAYYDTDLIYSVDGGPESTIDMFAMGGQQFRAEIPDSPDSTITWRVESTDLNGNTGVSDTQAYRQGAGGEAWTDLGDALGGVSGDPLLSGTGSLVTGTAWTLDLTNAASSALAVLYTGLTDTPTAFKGGLLHPVPILASFVLATDGSGEILLGSPSFPPGLPSGSTVIAQYAIDDAAAVAGTALSNALRGDIP